MTEADLDAIFNKIKDGVSNTELERVAAFVRESKDTNLQYQGLYILGWAGAREYAPLMASFLTRTDDICLPQIAIRALTRWFDDAAPYLGMLKIFLRGIPQDEGGFLQQVALQVAGDAFWQTKDPDVLSLIVSFATRDDEILRDDALNSLVIALSGEYHRSTPGEQLALQRSADLADYLKQARERLESPAPDLA